MLSRRWARGFIAFASVHLYSHHGNQYSVFRKLSQSISKPTYTTIGYVSKQYFQKDTFFKYVHSDFIHNSQKLLYLWELLLIDDPCGKIPPLRVVLSLKSGPELQMENIFTRQEIEPGNNHCTWVLPLILILCFFIKFPKWWSSWYNQSNRPIHCLGCCYQI